MTSDFEGCVMTFDQVKEELEEIERNLARRQGIKRQVRRTLIEQIRNGTLVEDELVAQWHDAYSSYLEWTRAENWGDPPPLYELTPPPGDEPEKQEAAQAASSLFVAREGFLATTFAPHANRPKTGAICSALLSWAD